ARDAQPLPRPGQRRTAGRAGRRRQQRDQLGGQRHGPIVARRSRRISTRTSQLRAVTATSLPVHAGWTFAPIVLVALAAYVVVYVARWRTSRAEGGARAAPVGRLVLWCSGVLLLFVALISPIDDLGEQLA